MNTTVANIESRIKEFTRQHEYEWLVVCGLKIASYNEMLKILQLIRDEKLHELEAMMAWRMEYLELDNISEDGENLALDKTSRLQTKKDML